MQITSTNFDQNEPLPEKYSAYGENINPLLTFSEIPDNTASLLLIVDDPDAPNGLFTHWIVYNMSPATLQIIEGEIPLSGIEGVNDTGKKGYFGPKPPSGTHRYFFRLFALDISLEFPDIIEVNREEIDQAIDGHVIEKTELIGTYTKEEE